MIRSSAALAARTFDLLVVGGGVYGLTIAYDAAQRGLSVALIERDDFGSGSSFNHARTIHGGLRYLQSLDIARSRESIRERRTLARIAPHAVQQVPFVLPLTRSLTRGPLALRLGLLLDRLVARDRNEGIPATHHLPPGRVLTPREALSRFPLMSDRDLAGAAVWYDYVTTEADRLTFSWGLAAAAHGAVLVNYMDATALVTDGGRVVGVGAVDRLSNTRVSIAAEMVVCACGARTDTLLAPLNLSTGTPLLEALNLVTTRPAERAAIGGRTASGKTFFIVPYHGRSIFGTWESAQPAEPEPKAERRNVVDAAAPPVGAFLDALNEAYPAVRLTHDDVSLVHRGLVPALTNADGTVRLEGHERIREYRDNGVDRLLTVLGAKYTTARAVAERVTDRVASILGRQVAPCQTAARLLSGDSGSVRSAVDTAALKHRAGARVDDLSLSHLVSSYGSDSPRVLDLALSDAALCERVDAASAVIVAELVWAARHEMAVTLGDALIRRTPVGALGDPGGAVLERAATIVGNEWGWPEARRQSEIAAVREFYKRATARGTRS